MKRRIGNRIALVAFTIIPVATALAQDKSLSLEDIDQVLNNSTQIDAQCTRSLITVRSSRLPLRCTERLVHTIWPNGRASIMFIAVDENEKKLMISFNANSDNQLTLREYTMKLHDVRFGPLSEQREWKEIRISGKCSIKLANDKGTEVDSVTCLGRARANKMVFDFATGSGRVIKLGSR